MSKLEKDIKDLTIIQRLLVTLKNSKEKTELLEQIIHQKEEVLKRGYSISYREIVKSIIGETPENE